MLRKNFGRVLITLITLVVLVGFHGHTAESASATSVNLPPPPWWSGSTCDNAYYSAQTSIQAYQLSASPWNGLSICGPGPTQGGADLEVSFGLGGGTGIEWECTELVKRYLYLWLNTPALDQANGYQIVSRYAETYPRTFLSVPNDGSMEKFPEVGDVLSYGDGDPYNHTAIVTGVAVLDQVGGDATLTIIEQNAASTGTTTQNVVDWIIRGGPDSPNDYSSIVVTGWLTPRWKFENIHNAGYFTALTGSSSSDVWAVGPGLAYHYDGSTWGSDTISGALDSYAFSGATTLSDGTTLAVGNSSYYAVAAVKPYVGNWSAASVYRPSTMTWFTAVDSDSNDSAWVVGYTYQSYAYRPLIETYNPNNTSFYRPASVPNPFPVYNSRPTKLFAVKVLSNSDIWAAGYYEDTSSHRHPLTLHFDGSNWTYYEVPEPVVSGETVVNPQLTSIEATSTGELWVGGHYILASAPGTSRPLLSHWVPASSAWVTDVTVSTIFVGAPVLSLTADTDGGLYAAGLTGSIGISKTRPAVLYYDGQSWVQVLVPPIDFSASYSKFNSIFATSDGSSTVLYAAGVQDSNTLFVESATMP